MNKIAQKMLHHKKGIVALFAVLAVLCALLSRRVKVDYNMMHYLPKDAPSTIALDVMEEEYSAKTANCRIMIEDAAIPEALALKKQLQQVPGVSEVMWLDDYANVYAPLETLDGDTVESWYKEGNVLFTCYVDEDDLYSHLISSSLPIPASCGPAYGTRRLCPPRWHRNFCRAFCVKSWASTGLSSPTRHTWWASQEKCGAVSSCPLPCRAAAI